MNTGRAMKYIGFSPPKAASVRVTALIVVTLLTMRAQMLNAADGHGAILSKMEVHARSLRHTSIGSALSATTNGLEDPFRKLSQRGCATGATMTGLSKIWLPRNGDLRFQQVGETSTSPARETGRPVILWYPVAATYKHSTGTPIRLGLGQCVPGQKQDCGWLYATYELDHSDVRSTSYRPNILKKLDEDLSGLPPSTVVTSLDIESANDVFALSAVDGGTPSFDLRHEAISETGLDSVVKRNGASGRVVTAITFDSSSHRVHSLSYGWKLNGKTVYETCTRIVPYDQVGPAAIALSSGGYIISAFGGNGADGYILVGTRVKGKRAPRPILVSPNATISTDGFALVGWAVNTVYGRDPSPPVWIYQR